MEQAQRESGPDAWIREAFARDDAIQLGAMRRDEFVAEIDESRPIVIGAFCNFRFGQRPIDNRRHSFAVGEFLGLESGRIVVLHAERGFSTFLRSTGPEPPVGGPCSVGALRSNILNTVLPGDDESGEDHDYLWLCELATNAGIQVTVEELKELPYKVVITRDVWSWLGEISGILEL